MFISNSYTADEVGTGSQNHMTYGPRDICSPTQISLIIMQQWEVFPQGKMFPQVRRLLCDTCTVQGLSLKYIGLIIMTC